MHRPVEPTWTREFTDLDSVPHQPRPIRCRPGDALVENWTAKACGRTGVGRSPDALARVEVGRELLSYNSCHRSPPAAKDAVDTEIAPRTE
ncbi:hypothetical protein GPOL_c07740 [Gordonia polyisoprenivorans VH2]|uniref:Uncharacterized protein n=1 Tax=Gordonia polyisoprenivorans (strain DSM 44266 / VH2) TaxID=1112204 RepID=H6MXS2_GORPV|nr:hypothetical protein GPOL_c07740 [Gordonia polyisoprenivorans VH2]